jgi:transposase
MELSQKQFKRIAPLLPKQRGHVKIANLTLLNALIYIGENGCKWRALPEKFGPWHSVYMRFNRWAKNGVLERVVTALQAEHLLDLKVFSLDSTSIKVHPDAQGALKKRQTGDREVTGGMEYENPCGCGKRHPG